MSVQVPLHLSNSRISNRFFPCISSQTTQSDDTAGTIPTVASVSCLHGGYRVRRLSLDALRDGPALFDRPDEMDALGVTFPLTCVASSSLITATVFTVDILFTPSLSLLGRNSFLMKSMKSTIMRSANLIMLYMQNLKTNIIEASSTRKEDHVGHMMPANIMRTRSRQKTQIVQRASFSGL
jgi:hypothetical protein